MVRLSDFSYEIFLIRVAEYWKSSCNEMKSQKAVKCMLSCDVHLFRSLRTAQPVFGTILKAADFSRQLP